MTDIKHEDQPAELTPANQNPWYILATWHGEYDENLTESEEDYLLKKNRLFWHRFLLSFFVENEAKTEMISYLIKNEVHLDDNLKEFRCKKIAVIIRMVQWQIRKRNPVTTMLGGFVDYFHFTLINKNNPSINFARLV